MCLHCVGMDTNYECDPNMQPYRVFGQIYQNGRRLICRDPPGKLYDIQSITVFMAKYTRSRFLWPLFSPLKMQ